MKRLIIAFLFLQFVAIGFAQTSAPSYTYTIVSKKFLKDSVSETIKKIKIVAYLKSNHLLNKDSNIVDLINGKLYVNQIPTNISKSLINGLDNFELSEISKN